jgi:3-methyladenine DNA glycosylase/8-oxoguanine DNA glycosylase
MARRRFGKYAGVAQQYLFEAFRVPNSTDRADRTDQI